MVIGGRHGVHDDRDRLLLARLALRWRLHNELGHSAGQALWHARNLRDGRGILDLQGLEVPRLQHALDALNAHSRGRWIRVRLGSVVILARHPAEVNQTLIYNIRSEPDQN